MSILEVIGVLYLIAHLGFGALCALATWITLRRSNFVRKLKWILWMWLAWPVLIPVLNWYLWVKVKTSEGVRTYEDVLAEIRSSTHQPRYR